jgi:hypothetical protein
MILKETRSSVDAKYVLKEWLTFDIIMWCQYDYLQQEVIYKNDKRTR